MSTRLLTKVLAGIEDLFLGSGTVVQERGSGNQTITAIGGATLPYDNDPNFTIKNAIGAIIGGTLVRFSIQGANFGKGVTAPTQVILANYTGWEYNLNDDSVITISLPADVDVTENIEFHIEWYIDEAYVTNSGEVQWHMEWSATPHDSSEAIDAPADTGSFSTGDINIPATAKYLTHTTSMIIAAGNLSEEDVLGIILSRIGLVGGNNPAAHPVIISAHLEYTRKL